MGRVVALVLYSGGVYGVLRGVASGRWFFFSNFPPARGFFCRLLWAGLGLRAGPAVGLGAGWRTGLAAWVGGGIALEGNKGQTP